MAPTFIDPDLSFERHSVGLDLWLVRLVADDASTRDAAGAALQAMEFAQPGSLADRAKWRPVKVDLVEHRERLAAAIRATAIAPGFDAEDFVTRLCLIRIKLKRAERARTKKYLQEKAAIDARWERISERITQRINANPESGESDDMRRRLIRALAVTTLLGCEDLEKSSHFSPTRLTGPFMSYVVFGMFDAALLAAPEALQMMLEEPCCNEALEAIERIGPAAIGLAPALFDLIDGKIVPEPDSPMRFGAQALGSVGKGNRQVVGQLIDRLKLRDAKSSRCGATALTRMDGDVAGRNQEILPFAYEMARSGDWRYWGIQFLASVGRNDAEVRRHVLDLAGPRKPDLKSYDGLPDYKFDANMWARGVAIDAIRCFHPYPDECLPVLIEALDTFQEYDPDVSYQGSSERIARTLRCFGAAAAPAARALAQKLRDSEEFPTAILATLAHIGPAIPEPDRSIVLAILESFQREQLNGQPEDPFDPTEPEPVRDTIDSIRFGTKDSRGRQNWTKRR